MLKIKNDAFLCVLLALVVIVALLGFVIKMCTQNCFEVIKITLTSFIAIVAAYIAYRQYETNQQKLILDLYDRRSKIYAEIKKILSLIGQKQSIAYAETLEFYHAVAEADFLLDGNVIQHIEEIYKRSIQYIYDMEQLQRHRDDDNEEEYHRLGEIVLEHKIWFAEQHKATKEIFEKYLSFKHISHQ